MSFLEDNFCKYLSLIAILSQLLDSLKNRANNATDAEKGFLAPLIRFMEGLLEALDSRRGSVMLGEYSTQFREEIAFYSAMLQNAQWPWSKFSHLLPDDYDNALKTLSEFVEAFQAQCKFNF